MRLTRRTFTTTALAATALPLARANAAAENVGKGVITRSHGASLVGPLKYGADFPHYDYVNPDAPKGGTARLASRANFDSFNPFIVKGTPPQGIGLVYETLMAPPLDQSSTEYGLLAEWIEYPDDQSWVAFRLRDTARWHDGVPVTVDDVIFSFEALTKQGAPQYRFYYANVIGARDMGDRVVRFDFDTQNNRELPHIMSQLSILPKHWWEGRDFTEGSLDRPLGSGPYRVGKFETGRFVEYERVKDYWGADLPVNIGSNNFDQIRFEVFLDSDVAFEGFKSGAFDFRDENSAKKWALQYDFPAVKDGRVKTLEYPSEGPKPAQFYALNLRKDKFSDRRVRQALGLAYDFEWTNKTVYFGQYARVTSTFQGSPDLMPTGEPSAAELALLEPLRNQIPPEVFGEAWTPPTTDGSGRNRRNIRRASKLLEAAGCVLVEGILSTPNGEPFKIEFLIYDSNSERALNPWIANLKRLGIEATLRLVDFPQYVRTIQQDPEFSWDVIGWQARNSSSPGNEQREFWGSRAANEVGARNVSGVADPAVDALIDHIIAAKDRTELSVASRALDRVLMWNNYFIPQIFSPNERLAWWDKFGRPDPLPGINPGFPSIWWSTE
ncbi:MAG: extracellular solute-binding protein [Pikeienuella sp.]